MLPRKDSSRCVVVQLQRPQEAVVRVEVTVLGRHLENSPRVISFTVQVLNRTGLGILQ